MQMAFIECAGIVAAFISASAPKLPALQGSSAALTPHGQQTSGMMKKIKDCSLGCCFSFNSGVVLS